MLDFHWADSRFFAFFVDDFLDCPPGSFQLELPQFSFFGLFEYGMYKISTPQYPLVPLFLVPRPASGYDLGPAAETAQQPAAGQLRLMSEPDPFLHELAVLCHAFSSAASKLQEDVIHVRPGMVGFPDDGPVAAKGIAVEFFDGFYDVRPQGVQVYVADEGKEVAVFVAEDGFVAVFE